jgi:hypothetical protein
MSDKGKDEKPKIIIDSDWKAEAQREKERLAHEEAETSGGAGRGPHGLPEADFSGLVNILMMQALVGLGGMRGAGGQPIPPNPEVAKYNIDLLGVLEDKCRNNMTPDEKRLLDMALYELRMRYVQVIGAATGVTAPGVVPEER